MPPNPADKHKPTADRSWGDMNQAVRNDVPRSLMKAKKSILRMTARRRRG